MSVALLLITHDTIGNSMLETATNMLGICPLATENLAITNQQKLEAMQERAEMLCKKIDQGDGILILTDMYGSTPSNIASRLLNTRNRTVVTGLNLPMLVRVMNYAQLNLQELANKAMSSIEDSVFLINQPADP